MSPEEALDKLKNWCAYQERSQFDVRKKLFSFKLVEEEGEHLIAQLIEENFLNEERFAMAFAGGKFRIKHWGKQKIKLELKKHKVSDYSINKALASLGEVDYDKGMKLLVAKKLSQSKHTDRRKRYYSILKYAVSKGYESDLVSKELNKLLGESYDES
jgi:regulatory protein